MESATILERSDHMKLKNKLVLGSMGLVIVTLTLVLIIFIIMINSQFNGYLDQIKENHRSRVIEEITQILQEESENSFEDISLYAAMNGFHVELLSKEGDILFTSGSLNGHGMMGREVSLLQIQNMPMYADVEVTSHLITSGQEEYLLNLGFMADDSLSSEARQFVKTIYITAGITFLLALILAYFVSIKLAKPISADMRAIEDKAGQITQGDYTGRLETSESIEEIKSLHLSIEDMATTLHEQESLRKDLLETVSHEVKTPLTVLRSQVESFLDGVYEPDQLRLEKCLDEIQRLELLMERMEDAQILDKHKYLLDNTEFSLEEELEAIGIILAPQLTKKNLEIQIKGQAIGNIIHDRFKLRQILYNLLSNAYKFSDPGTAVTIEKSQPKDHVFQIRVINRGIVIGEEDMDKIFESHYRSQAALQADPYGKGLGLNISKNLADRMKGQLDLVSSDEEATVFALELPISAIEKE